MGCEKGLSYGTNSKKDINLYEIEQHKISGPLLRMAAVGQQIIIMKKLSFL